MTSMRDGWDADYGSRAADSAECLLVVGGYREFTGFLHQVVEEAKDQMLMSPSLGDFFELRLADMGPRPDRPADGAAGVARLVLELTSRPGEAARNFSALLLIDRSAAVIDQLLRDCRADPVLSKLKLRYSGMASVEDRPPPARGQQPPGSGLEIAIAPTGKWYPAEIVAEICRYAENLFGDFGSGWEPGLDAERLSEISSEAEPELRGVIAAAAAADEKAAFKAPKAELKRKAAVREEAALKDEAHRREARRREEEFQKEVELRREAEFRKEVELRKEAALRRVAELRREAQLREEAEARGTDAAVEQESRHAKAARERDRTPEEPPRHTLPLGPADIPGHEELDRTAGDQTRRAVEGLPAGQARPAAPTDETVLVRRPARTLAVWESGAYLLDKVRRRPKSLEAGETMLLECVARMRAGDRKEFKAGLSSLRAHADANPEISADDRERYRVIVIEDRLLRPGLPLGSLDVPFYELLLRLAFGVPLSYQGYCGVEDCLELAGQADLPPHRPLLEAIERAGTADVRVTAITLYYLGWERLDKWLRSRQLNVGPLIDALAGEWDRPHHADLCYEVTLRYLNETQGRHDRKALVQALRKHGYLVPAVRRQYPDSRPDQVTVLTAFLRAAYPKRLDRSAVKDIFGESKPTRVLTEAVLRVLADPADGPWVVRAFARRHGADDIDPGEEAELLRLLTADRSA